MLPLRLLQGSAGVVLGLALPSLDLNFIAMAASGVLDPRITFTRGSTGTRINASGNIESIASGVPRFTYNPSTLAPLGLLVETQKTNLLLNSQINGTNLSTQNVTVAAVAYVLSFYGTGTITLTGASTAGPLVGGGAYPTRSILRFTPTAGTLTVTVSGTVQYAQLEASSANILGRGRATSFIPTGGAAVTRSPDWARMEGANFSSWYNQSQGTVVVTAMNAFTNDPTALAFYVSANSESVADLMLVNFASGNSQFRYDNAGYSTIVNMPIPGYTAIENAMNTIALSYRTGAFFSVANNSPTFGSDLTGQVQGGMQRCGIGCNGQNSNQQLDGPVSRLTYYPVATPGDKLGLLLL